MGMRMPALLAGICLAAAGAAWGAPDGGTTSPFELGAGSRALAMGGAYAAVADDVTALFWNPAGLARVDQVEISAMHLDLYFETPYDFFGAALPLLDWGTFAAGVARVATGGIVSRDARSYVTGEDGQLELREYLLGYGRELPWGLAVGTTLKVDQQRLLGMFTAGVGVDAGVQFALAGMAGEPEGAFDWRRLRFGVHARNVVGSRLRLDADTDILPLNMIVQAGYPMVFGDAWRQRLMLTGGVEKSTWRDLRPRVGLEYSVFERVALRGGMENDAWTAGAGFNLAGVTVDYALAGMELGLTHRFTLGYRFGKRLSEQRREREQRRQEELDREAEKRAREAVAKAQADMEKTLKDEQERFRKERRQLEARQEQRLNAERRQQATARRAAVEQEYFKALHYFQGLRDFQAKRYSQAITEFETVDKYDPGYMEVAYYLERARQLAEGRKRTLAGQSLEWYYEGIDLYVENRFAEAIAVWQRILEKDPGQLLVIRNIEEARSRMEILSGTGADTAAPPAAP